jgi:hypothetical protein
MTSRLRLLIMLLGLTCLPTLLAAGCEPGPSDSGNGPQGAGAELASPRQPPGQADCTEISGVARLPEGAAEPQGDLEVLFLAPGTLRPTGRPSGPPLDFLHVTNRPGLPLHFSGCAPQAKLEIAAYLDMDGDHEVMGRGDHHGRAAVEIDQAGLTDLIILLDARFDEGKEGVQP